MGRQHWVSQDRLGHANVTSGPRVSVAHGRGWFLAQGSGWRTHPPPRALAVSRQRGQRPWSPRDFVSSSTPARVSWVRVSHVAQPVLTQPGKNPGVLVSGSSVCEHPEVTHSETLL